MPQLAENFEKVVADHTAGDPVHEDVKWTNLTQQQIAAGLDEAGTPVSVSVVRKLLQQFGYKRRKASKVLAMGKHPHADAQFAEIAKQRKRFLNAEQPVLRIDTKKKELLGNFARPGELKQHAASLWQIDFFSKRILTLKGIREVFVLSFLHVESCFHQRPSIPMSHGCGSRLNPS